MYLKQDGYKESYGRVSVIKKVDGGAVTIRYIQVAKQPGAYNAKYDPDEDGYKGESN